MATTTTPSDTLGQDTSAGAQVDQNMRLSPAIIAPDTGGTSRTASSSAAWPSLGEIAPLPTTDPERLFSPRNLKKSVSMDSLDTEHQADSPLGETEDGRAGASTDVERSRPYKSSGSLSSPPSSLSLSNIFRSRSRSSRRRGASHSTTDNDTSTQDESDFDKTSMSSKVKTRVRQRLLSFKGTKPSPSDQDPLPLPNSSRRSSFSKLNLPEIPALPNPSPPSAYPFPPEYSGPIRQELRHSGRSRSFSVGAQSGSTSRVGTPTFDKRRSVQENLRIHTIGVVGCSGSGKTAFIKKSLKKHDLSNHEQQVASMSGHNTTREIRFHRRTARFCLSAPSANAEVLLTVYELSTKDWTHSDGTLLSVWPSGLPRADGIFICYDASNPKSFKNVVDLLVGYRALNIPAIVLACKSDLEKRIEVTEAGRVVEPYCKIIEVNTKTDDGKGRTKKSIEAMLRLINEKSRSRAERRAVVTPTPTIVQSPVANPQPDEASTPPVKEIARLSTQELSSLPLSLPQLARSASQSVSHASVSHSPPSPSSPTRVRSMNDLLSRRLDGPGRHCDSEDEHAGTNNRAVREAASKSDDALHTIAAAVETPVERLPDIPVVSSKRKAPAPSPWTTFNELLEKLIFLVTSGDDLAFVKNFFLTYRRFTTPRSVLLGLQKRMVELNAIQGAGDVTLACFTQMRICNLLEQWITDYPADFTVPGTTGALNAFIRQILQHSHTLMYGSDFLPFLEEIPKLVDLDAGWAKKPDFTDSDESESMFGDDTESENADAESPLSGPIRSDNSPVSASRSTARERRSSLPLSAMSLIKPYSLGSRTLRSDSQSLPSEKDVISRLQKAAAALSHYDADAIAQEVTRRELNLFLKIQPRHWLRHTLLPGKKDPSVDPIARFNSHYNDLHEWAVSLILCHDKPKARARQIEKLAEVAIKLRALNNYSGLRAMITAINQATYNGDAPMEIFKSKTELHKKYLSSDILLRTTGAHQSYRMALRNTKGACIPSLEVHTSDLRRANEGNPDMNEDDASKINWAKYNMIGKFVETTTEIQERCRGSSSYDFTENRLLSSLFDVPPMSYEIQQSRISQPPEDDFTANYYSTNPGLPGHAKEASVIKRILAW